MTIGSISLQTNLRTLDLTDFSPLIGAGQTVTLDYTDPSTGDDTNAIQDINGLDAASFSNVVVNDSVIAVPTPTAAAVPAAASPLRRRGRAWRSTSRAAG